MIRQDFIMRMIKQFINIMFKVTRLRRENKHEEARQMIEQTWDDLFGLSYETADSLSEYTVLGMVTHKNTMNLDLCLMVAWLYKASGEIGEVEHQEETSYKNYLKALNVYLEIATHNTVLKDKFRLTETDEPREEALDPHEEIDTLLEKLKSYVLPLPTQQVLFEYFEKFGRYAKAEDILFHMVDEHPHNPETIEMGQAFFQRLFQKNDEDLAAGNLTRAEIEEGIGHLKAKE